MEKNQVDYHGHYYGRLIRLIFVVAGFVMLATFPFFSHLISLPMPVSLFAIILLVVIGGLINPLSKWVFVLGTIVPIIAVIMFEYYAYYAYQNLSAHETINVFFFWVNQILSLIFFFAAYLSIKTLRVMLQGKMTDAS